ncbi:MAG: nucleotidyltransferase [Erysipelotrichaceae bacterium]|nr:nucleotidyltransferase [Erysipelotrichaceae bacterium]
MKEPALVILAAGMGSRYGGLKQVDTVGNNGESIIDFSIYDAYRAGFRKLVLIIRKEHEDLFEQQIAGKLRGYMDVYYAYQDINDLPNGYQCPEGRTKPWGTVQAVLSTRNVVDGPFMVINADDFYGPESYQIMYDFLKNEVTDDTFGMVGYQLTKTLTDNGSVTRGICETEDGYLTKIVETQKIIRKNGKPYSIDEEGNETELVDGVVSMNYWGMTPAIFPLLEREFTEFLAEKVDVPKSELVIPTSVANLIANGDIRVKVMSTNAEWFGVTYPQDKQMVTDRLLEYKAQEVYPFQLWK